MVPGTSPSQARSNATMEFNTSGQDGVRMIVPPQFSMNVADEFFTRSENLLKGDEHLLYSRCLLKTLTLSELKEQMISQNIPFNANDPLSTLCLRTRLYLLNKHNLHGELCDKLTEEILSGSGRKYGWGLVMSFRKMLKRK